MYCCGIWGIEYSNWIDYGLTRVTPVKLVKYQDSIPKYCREYLMYYTIWEMRGYKLWRHSTTDAIPNPNGNRKLVALHLGDAGVQVSCSVTASVVE